MKRGLLVGFLLWLVATLVLRFAPAWLLPADRPTMILGLYAGSFALFFVLIRRFVGRFAASSDAVRAGVALFLPTLALDAPAAGILPGDLSQLFAHGGRSLRRLDADLLWRRARGVDREA